jgi:hypothetical protein
MEVESLVQDSGTEIELLFLNMVVCTGVKRPYQKRLSQNTTVCQVQYENVSKTFLLRTLQIARKGVA